MDQGAPESDAGVLTLFAPVYFALLVTRPWRPAVLPPEIPSRAVAALVALGLLVTDGVPVLTLSRGGTLATSVGLLSGPAVARWPRARVLALAPVVGLMIVSRAMGGMIPDPYSTNQSEFQGFIETVGVKVRLTREDLAAGNFLIVLRPGPRQGRCLPGSRMQRSAPMHYRSRSTEKTCHKTWLNRLVQNRLSSFPEKSRYLTQRL